MTDSEDRQPDRPGGDDPGRGRRLGVDVGTVRIGVATSDPDGILATPVETVPRDRRDVRGKHIRRLAQLADEYAVVEVVVGLPRTLADRTGPSALDAIAVADALSARIAPVPVRLSDERLTTVSAQRSLREAGIRAKGQRSMIDQAAAVGILQTWLDQRRAALATAGGDEEHVNTSGREEHVNTSGAADG
ncbi:Holliday junction resolvase RuvX [Mycolicibacterium sp. 050158]|uniref:Holliday junction resolvase RuvX n=1 Tax=Mycolicibacterium sp. 050158 TaxID=3090602 RepID=UPI00299D1AA3|nr:Holliday junction resolvase RuvX [Mycolicibacterium sp. 050158]MDX1890902.1 Holliday junction resolvase RuvX [Mycolicibacterium sp. 050158]